MTPMQLLFPDTKLTQAQTLDKFEVIFAQIPPLPEAPHREGRIPVPIHSLLSALIYKNLRSLPDFSSLVREIRDSSALQNILRLKSDICVERFSAILRDTPNPFFQNVREAMVRQLRTLGTITGRWIALDSCPVYSPVKENNMKTVVKDRFDKTKILKGDSDARLGTIVTFPNPGEKKVAFFWGYRNFVTLDVESELPIGEITKPANIHEVNLIVPQLQHAREKFHFQNIEAVLGDAAFDSAFVIEFIAKDLKALPIIAKNPRAGQGLEYKLSTKGAPICVAGLEMASHGIFFDKVQKRWRQKFICPIKYSKKFAKKISWCPWNHPKFVNNRYGCMTYLRTDVDESIRKAIPYGTIAFKKLYAKRTSVERGFARLLSLCMQYPTVHGLQAISNWCTIAHITALAIALTAVRTGHPNKLRFVKKFIPSL